MFFWWGILLLWPASGQAQTMPRRIALDPYKLATDIDTTRGWRRGGTGSLNFSQVSLNNWAAGGQSSLSLLGIGNVYAHFRGEKHTFAAAVDLVYGLLKAGPTKIRKNDDRLEMNIRYARQYSEKWSYASQINIKTQLTPTKSTEIRDSLTSRFFAPAYILASAGWEYKPTDWFSVLLSPATGKFTVVNSQRLADYGAFGVQGARRDADGRLVRGTGKLFRAEAGGYMNARLTKTILPNVSYQTRLELFSNYFHKPQNVDVYWTNLVDCKVNKFISANVATILMYDDDILVPIGDGTSGEKGRRIQFKETLGIGLTYKF
ncbi:DUF3078 domain-containing protein [Hymenobacter aerilatus]|uniref:DUF3078 domain-containing protein n=1 Tax=Hymenobacter aerilatus TaxID=2932251 RepID=A0A8T9STT2_9BACT|nr:DUF3078 domain-containing protein [Hymenobacter aerilatus]UOR05235.1 DUF3078 domain-containing protein [Hymenobacter aerilatus]